MGRMKDLYLDAEQCALGIERLNSYRAGYKAPGTSADAAAAITPRVSAGQRLVLDSLQKKPQTADEVAVDIGRTMLFVRPRVSELKALNLIIDTGTRRKNESGLSANVWRARTDGD